MRKLFSTLSSTLLQRGVRGGLLLLALVATTSLWAHDFKIDGIYYNYLDGNNVEVTYRGNDYKSYYYEYAGEVIIPSTVTYNGTTYSVTSIGAAAFRDCFSLTSITIPNSVTSIGESAFSSCSSLVSMVVESGNTKYDSRDNCNAIIETATNILIAGCQNTIIPNSVTSIGNSAFAYCHSLTSITIPNSVTSIGDRAFSGCSSLTSITIPNSVTSIGNYAFWYCSSLTSITIPNSVTTVGGGMFYGCSKLKSVVLSNNITSLPSYNVSSSTYYGFFEHCSSLTSVTIPESVTSIGSSAFRYCSSLTSITIPNSVTNIGDWAFHDCSSLTSVTIPNNVTSIGEWAFRACSSLTSLTIGNSVTGDYAFAWCESLTSVTIGNSVTSIGTSAFHYCYSLTSITCEATTPPTLGTSVFNDTKLSAVYIPDNTLSAYQTAWGNEYAFVNNETTLTLHVATPGTLSDLIFDAGTRPALVLKLTLTGTLNDADFTCMRETMTSLVDVDLSGITNTSGVHFDGKENLVRIILPTNLTSIGDNAFNSCSSLTSVTIPNSVTSIGSSAFRYCSSLTSITIPNSVTSIGDEAFYRCKSLTSITIPNSVTSIGTSAFSSCVSLTSVTIPNSVTSIGDCAFESCSALTSIVVESGNSTYDSRNNCNAIIETATNTLIIGCQNTIIPNSVTSIGDRAFYYCEGLTSITIPNSVTSIGDRAFYYCSSLDTLTCLAMTPPALGESVFYGCDNPTLYVPCEALPDYQAHEQWGKFTTIECISSEEADTEEVVVESGTTTIQKIIRDGQFIILRDGIEYNAMGTEIQ